MFMAHSAGLTIRQLPATSITSRSVRRLRFIYRLSPRHWHEKRMRRPASTYSILPIPSESAPILEASELLGQLLACENGRLRHASRDRQAQQYLSDPLPQTVVGLTRAGCRFLLHRPSSFE